MLADSLEKAVYIVEPSKCFGVLPCRPRICSCAVNSLALKQIGDPIRYKTSYTLSVKCYAYDVQHTSTNILTRKIYFIKKEGVRACVDPSDRPTGEDSED